MAHTGPIDRSGRALGETWAVGLGSLLLFLLGRQTCLHGTDWRWLVLWLDEPGAVHPQHPGYLPLARGLRWLLQPLGLDVHSALLVFSALGGAVAVAGIHRATLAMAGDRRSAVTAAALASGAPALLHFATVVELHAPFAAAMAWALWAAVRWTKAPTVHWALVAGTLTGAATLLHATGHLLVPAVAAAVVWRGRAHGVRQGLVQCAWFALAHMLVWGGVFAAMRAFGHLPEAVAGFAALPQDLAAPDHPLAYLARWWAGMDLRAQAAPTVLAEWLEPYAPCSVLFLLALATKRLRAEAALLLAALAVYLVVTVALVHAVTDERGAYLLPLLAPALWLVLAAVPRRLWPVLVGAALVCGFTLRGEPGRLPPDRAFGEAAAALATVQPTVFLVADWPEMDGAFLADARLELRVARKEHGDLAVARATVGLDPTSEQVVGWLLLLAREPKQRGAWFVVTDLAAAWLAERVPAFGTAWPVFLQQAGAQRLDAATGIAGYVVR